MTTLRVVQPIQCSEKILIVKYLLMGIFACCIFSGCAEGRYHDSLISDILDYYENMHDAKMLPEVYFAHPHAPWQKGAVENGNGLIRQYIPNGTDFNNVSQQQLKDI